MFRVGWRKSLKGSATPDWVTFNRRFPEITGEIIQKSEVPWVGHHFRHGFDLYTGTHTHTHTHWRRQSKSAGLWQYQTFRHGPILYWTASCALCARNTFFLSFFAYYGLLVGPHAVCPFGMEDWLNRLRAFIIYTVFLITKKKCKKSSAASAASSVALRSRSLRAEDRIQKQE